MEEKREYTCGYCKVGFVPKRRGVQKFCSASCRVRSHQVKKKALLVKNSNSDKNKLSEKMKVEKISIAGVGNAAAGTGLVMVAKHLLTKEENRPATKKDLRDAELRIIQILDQNKKENNPNTDTFGLNAKIEWPKL